MIGLAFAAAGGLLAGVLLGFRWGLSHALEATAELYGAPAAARVRQEALHPTQTPPPFA